MYTTELSLATKNDIKLYLLTWKGVYNIVSIRARLQKCAVHDTIFLKSLC